MTDIVYWLREHDRARDIDAWMSCEKAADEIERLRAALRRWDKVVSEYGDAESAWQNGELDDEAYHASYNAVMEYLYEARAALGEKE